MVIKLRSKKNFIRTLLIFIQSNSKYLTLIKKKKKLNETKNNFFVFVPEQFQI